MSHELRTPLNAVIGYAQLLDLGISGPVSPQQREQLGRINRSAAHLLGLIDEVLTVTSAPEGSRVTRPVAVRPAVADVVMMCAPQAAAKGIDLRVGDLPDAGAEPQWLRHILVNLIVNAIKFTERGHVALSAPSRRTPSCSASRTPASACTAEHRVHVILPFWRVDQGTTRGHGGTGLGLAVSRALAGLMGGRIGWTPALQAAARSSRCACLSIPPGRRGGASSRLAARTVWRYHPRAANPSREEWMHRLQHIRGFSRPSNVMAGSLARC